MKPKLKPGEYSYDLFGGPYDGGTVVVEWDDIIAFTDRTMRFDDHYGFYTMVGFCGYYGTRECEPGEFPFIADNLSGIFEREK